MMKFNSGVIIAGLVVVLSACSTPTSKVTPTNKATPAPDRNSVMSGQVEEILNDLQTWLPGYYSNYTQVIEAGGNENSVTDLTIRQLIAENETVFLFESRQRNAIDANYDLYFARLNPQSGQPELHFARMTGSDLSKALPETLDIGWQRALPGCVISLAPLNLQGATFFKRRLFGKSQTETCHFEDPIHGKTTFKRSLGISKDLIEMTEVELKPGEVIGETVDDLPAAMIFRKHQAYEGAVSFNMDILSESAEPGGWQQSTTFNTYDDGRLVNLYDSDMQPMDYAIRLSRMHWLENQPPYPRIEIVELKSGQVQAYSRIRPEPNRLDWELDWVQVHLKELDLDQQ